jgi:hypothetical protein
MTPLVAEVAGAIKKFPGSWSRLKIGRRGRRSKDVRLSVNGSLRLLGRIHGTGARNVTLDFAFQKEAKKILGLCGM